nr:MAG TPA: MTAbl13 of grafted MCoTI-II, trypsin inhibitor, Hydrolase Inhibitor [Caudoviricetes sp.]
MRPSKPYSHFYGAALCAGRGLCRARAAKAPFARPCRRRDSQPGLVQSRHERRACWQTAAGNRAGAAM